MISRYRNVIAFMGLALLFVSASLAVAAGFLTIGPRQLAESHNSGEEVPGGLRWALTPVSFYQPGTSEFGHRSLVKVKPLTEETEEEEEKNGKIKWEWAPKSKNFGSIAAGETRTEVVTITNTGTVAGTLGFAGVNTNPPFSYSGTGCANTTIFPAGKGNGSNEECKTTITFHPTAPGKWLCNYYYQVKPVPIVSLKGEAT
jgi:hypothetical protein